MTHQLRLHTDDATDPANDAPAALPFPAVRVRERLVAGRVERDPCAEAPAPGAESRPQLRLHRGEDQEPENMPTLVRQIERTLDRMQMRLDRVRRQMDDAMKFPSPPGGAGEDWPPRAA